MPSVFPPRLRWRPASLPLFEPALNPIERAQRVIAGSLILWASRRASFDWEQHPSTESVFRYCVARVNGERLAPRPSSEQFRGCIAQVGEQVDPECFQALNVLALSNAGEPDEASGADAPTLYLDFEAEEDAERSNEQEEGCGASAVGRLYGQSGEPPATDFLV